MKPAGTATAMAAQLASGETTARALAEEALSRIATINSDWHVFITVTAEQALIAADASDARRRTGTALGPLDGIPFAVKDNIDVAGTATTNGTGYYRDVRRENDAFVVARLREAGAVMLGKLNMHEGALGATTDNPFWGRCANPAVPGATPGGSSGGSGAAVAAGCVPIALGTDTMGSVRIPAAYCGVWGCKPTRGLVSSRGLSQLSWTLDTIGPLAATPDDLQLALSAMAVHDPEDVDGAEIPAGWTGQAAPVDLRDIVLGIPSSLDEVECEPAVIEAHDALIERARAAGTTLRTVSTPNRHPSAARRAGLLVSEAEVGSRIGADLVRGGEGFSANFRAMVDFGRRAPGTRIAAAYRHLHALRFATQRALEGLDALIMPTAAQQAFAHGMTAPANQADFTALANIAYCPAVAFPITTRDGKAPCSAQLLGKPFSEGRLIAIAAALSRLPPPFDRSCRDR